MGEFAPWNNPADQIGAMPWKEGGGPLSRMAQVVVSWLAANEDQKNL